MEPKELRIGNLVRCIAHLPIGFNSHKLIFAKVKEIRYNYIDSNMGTHKYSDIGPINLTENILLKSKFNILNEDSESSRLYSYHDFILISNEDGFGFETGTDDNVLIRNLRIKYVHELQNIYYDLSGSELDIILAS